MKQVIGIIGAFHLCQASIIVAKRRLDTIRTFLHQEVHVSASGRVGMRRRPIISDPLDTLLHISGIVGIAGDDVAKRDIAIGKRGLEQASFEQKRQLIELLLDRVVVTNEKVEIRYVIPTSANSEHTRICYLRSNYF
jgi:hypothetical protein